MPKTKILTNEHIPTDEQVKDLLNQMKADHPDGKVALPDWFNQIMITTGTNLGAAVMVNATPISTALISAMKIAYTIGVRAQKRNWQVETPRTNKAKNRMVENTEARSSKESNE